ncbi:predicted protein [Sclerotinia sclerotiorum 1980 UF-70]|uniref:Uncharacterized protein n=1 Tax=Sclerotinia sclerotiorum (strain ATCC 18683 / 1980 / Ss-1) TaxID=665079 RepID=A7ER60_SCLS1|nr:predicted protein [Sclerotinia sclerotiorum 1980 UF-70]EDN91952.1 predicted protein [Sclerotinia sclerotiorum 1980 UF-70]
MGCSWYADLEVHIAWQVESSDHYLLSLQNYESRMGEGLALDDFTLKFCIAEFPVIHHIKLLGFLRPERALD